jgi:hypothetical protein
MFKMLRPLLTTPLGGGSRSEGGRAAPRLGGELSAKLTEGAFAPAPHAAPAR